MQQADQAEAADPGRAMAVSRWQTTIDASFAAYQSRIDADHRANAQQRVNGKSNGNTATTEPRYDGAKSHDDDLAQLTGRLGGMTVKESIVDHQQQNKSESSQQNVGQGGQGKEKKQKE